MKASWKEDITLLLERNALEEAESRLLRLQEQIPGNDEVYFLLGNLYRKQSNWQKALQCYAQAIEINPESPAVHARRMITEIMNFYDKERYNV